MNRFVPVLIALLVLPLGFGASRQASAQEDLCQEFESQSQAQDFLGENPEMADSLDPDGDGVACEVLLLDAAQPTQAATDNAAATAEVSDPTAEPDAEPHPSQHVNVELILDVSGSMAQTIDTGETRMDAAKRVLREVIGAIPAREGINVGLRVYGHKGDNSEERKAESCRSSELVASVSGVKKRELLAAIDGLQPTGWTPLALSLERAGEDFSPGEAVTNAAVLVTDGLETCGGDPCAIAGDLHNSDIELVTHVIGFALAPDEQATLGCIAEQGGGQLLGAANAAELAGALFQVLEELEVVQGAGFIGGNALALLPEGDAGELSVTVVGSYDGNVLPIVVRNNTGEDVIRTTAVVSAKNEAGQLIATGNDQGFNPNLVRSGGVSFGYAYFEGAQLPDETRFDFDIDAKPATDDRFENIRDLEVVEASTVEGRVVGTLQNVYDTVLTGPFGVDVVCLDEDGSLLFHQQDFSNKEQLAPDETVAVQVARFDAAPCPRFLIAGNGYDNSFGQGNDVEPPSGDGPAATRTTEEEVDEVAATSEPARSTVSVDVSRCPDLSSPEDVVLALQSRGMPVGEYEVYTAETDPNELLGRPGGYTGKANFRDTTLAPENTTFEVDDGGSNEIFETEALAEARANYIRVLTETSSLFAEYGFQQGAILLRLSHRLLPDQAKAYESQLSDLANCA